MPRLAAAFRGCTQQRKSGLRLNFIASLVKSRSSRPNRTKRKRENYRGLLREQTEADDAAFELEMANARLEASRRRLDFWQEMLTEMQLITTSLAEDTAKWRSLRSDAREASEAKKIAVKVECILSPIAAV